MSLYRTLLLVHVLVAIVWVGGAAITQVYAALAGRSDDPAEVQAFGRHIEWVGMRVFMPASLVLVAVGVWMVLVNDAWSFSQAWIWGSLGLYAASFLTGALYLGPTSGRIAALSAEQGPTAPAVAALQARLSTISRIELAALVAVVVMMVTKPGA